MSSWNKLEQALFLATVAIYFTVFSSIHVYNEIESNLTLKFRVEPSNPAELEAVESPPWVINEAQPIAKTPSSAQQVVCAGEWSREKVMPDSQTHCSLCWAPFLLEGPPHAKYHLEM